MPSANINLLINDTRVNAGVIDLITRLEVRESDGDTTVAALRLKLTQQPTGAFSPVDDDLFVAGSKLAIEVAAPGGLTQRLFEGVVTHLRPHFEQIESNCYLEVLGMDPAVILDASDRTASYPDASDSEAAQEIFDRYQIPAIVEDTAARHKADHQLLVQRASDWAFLKMLAARNGYCCYFEYDPDRAQTVGYFRKPALEEPPQADLTILQKDSNLRWVDLQWVMTGPVRHAGASIDPIRKRIIRSEGQPQIEPLGEDGLDGVIEQGLMDHGAESATALLRYPETTDAAISAQGSAQTDHDRFAIEARGELDPSLYRGMLRSRRGVILKGVGRTLSGIYYVTTVRTALEDGRLTQTFIALRNATGQSGQESFGQVAEEVPPQ